MGGLVMNITIDANSLQLLWCNEKSRKIATEILKKIKYSKYGYNDDAGNNTFLYWKCDITTAQKLLDVLSNATLGDIEGNDGYVSYSLSLVSVEFILQLVKYVNKDV